MSAQRGRDPSQRLRVAERAGVPQQLELLHHFLPPLDLLAQRLDFTLDLVGERQPLSHVLAGLRLVGTSKIVELRLERTRSYAKRIELVQLSGRRL